MDSTRRILESAAIAVMAVGVFVPAPARAQDGPASPAPAARPVDPRLGALMPFGARGQDRAPKDRAGSLVENGLRWLAGKQAADGNWSAATTAYDPGVTALALLAFLGAGYTSKGPAAYAPVVDKGLGWLRTTIDAEGFVGRYPGGHAVYNHAFGTLALVEAAGLTGDPALYADAQRALDLLARARNPEFGWRYDIKPGDNDTSVTACMWSAYHAAREVNRAAERAGLAAPFVLDEEVGRGVLAWLDHVIDAGTGLVGYQQRGTGSSRLESQVKRFPSERTLAMNGACVWILATLNPDLRNDPATEAAVGPLRRGLPRWSPDDGSVDFYGWYYGTLAAKAMGGDLWKEWSKAIEATLREGAFAPAGGAWVQPDAWSVVGGAAHTTALAVLALETPWRYDPPPDGRDVLALASQEGQDPWLRSTALRCLALRLPAKAAATAGKAVGSPAALVRRTAAEILVRTATPGDVPALLAATRLPDEDGAEAAARALARGGKPAAPALAEVLRSTSPRVRLAAATSLASLGPVAAAAADALRGVLADVDVAVQIEAARALWLVASDAAGLSVLLKRLDDADPTRRVLALDALRTMGTGAKGAEGLVVAALSDAVPAVRLAAARAALALRGGRWADVAVLSALLADGDPDLRVQAALAVGEAGPAGAPVVPALSRALVEGDPALRAAAGTALGIVRREARDALPALASARFDGDPAVERAAVEALGRLESGPVGHAAAGPAPADAKALATALADPVSAAATIESLAAGDPTSVALLRDALDDVDPVVRVRAAEALGGLGPLARGAEFSLLPLAKDPDPGVRAAALRSLVRIAATVPEAQTAFAAALNDADARVRYQALAGVTSVPRPSPAALRACAAALVDGDPGRTALAVEAAVRWKTPPDHAFWLAVVKLLETAPPSARVAAIRATSSSLDATHPLLVPVIDLAAVADATPVRAAAREAVVGRARKSPAVLAALVAHWYDAEASTANAYRELFAAVGDAAVPALAPYVGKGNEAKALQAVDLLDRSGAALLKSASLVLESSNGALAAVTWRVTAAFLDRRQAGVDAVVAALRHKSPAVRAGAAQLIARARGAFSPLLDALDEALRDAEAIEKDPAVAAAMRKAMEFRMR